MSRSPSRRSPFRSSNVWSQLASLAVLVGSLAYLFNCVDRPLYAPPREETTDYVDVLPQSLEKDVDILFMIDNSGSMSQEQANLEKNFGNLIEALRHESLGPDGSGRPCGNGQRSGCKIPNVHLGVVSSDLGAGSYGLPSCELTGGDKAKLQNTPRIAGCTPPTKPYISYIDGSVNVPGSSKDTVETVKEAFKCIAKLGTKGCGFEHQLEAARRAVDPKLKLNPGFVRDDALLAVVWITDEDDCSAQKPNLFDNKQQGINDPLGPITSFRCFEFGVTCNVNDRNQMGIRKNCVPDQDWLYPVQGYIDFFEKFKPGRVILAAIAGPTNRVEVGKDGSNPDLKASCSSGLGEAKPGIRLKAVIDPFIKKKTGQYTSICEGDFGAAMQDLGTKISGRLTKQCLTFPPLTENDGVVCQKGDEYAPGKICEKDCLEKASCEIVEESTGTDGKKKGVTVQKCPDNLWGYPEDRKKDPLWWEKQRDCGSTCPCWRLVKKSSSDPSKTCDPTTDGTPYALDILRKGQAAKGTVAKVACSAATEGWNSAELTKRKECI